MLRAAIILLMLYSPAFGQTVRIASGEHADFSRLVLSLPVEGPWSVGRTATGYELSLGNAATQFDVSRVFDLIPRTRLRGIYVDPESGNLQLSVGCNCHAVPFSLNARTIVVDLRDGPPPAGSSFEAGLDGRPWPPLQGATAATTRPRARPSQPTEQRLVYDWTKVDTPSPPAILFPLPVTEGSTDNLREVLVQQLAEGASRSVVDLALPENRSPQSAAPRLSDDMPIRITGTIGLAVGSDRVNSSSMQPDGEACLPEEALNLTGWARLADANRPEGEEAGSSDPTDAADKPVDAIYAGLNLDLVGEFDKPQATRVLAAAKQLIHMGFGAEARNMVTAFDLDEGEADLIKALGAIMDEEMLTTPNPFAGMQSCDTAAALWAFLSVEEGQLADTNLPALNRTFSALPMHLRTHLGPRVVDRLLAMDKVDAAVQIRALMGRGVVEDENALSLVTAEVLMATGKADQAVSQLEEVVADAGVHQAQALAALVSARISAGEPVTAETAEALEAFVAEHEGDPAQGELVAAHALALAASGQFARALAMATPDAPLDPVFWDLLATNGNDDDLLAMAVTPPLDPVSPEAIGKIADRLQTLGFTKEADAWRRLEGSTGEADTILADGEFSSVTAEPDPERLARWNEDWQTVAAGSDSLWAELAKDVLEPSTISPAPSLAEATAVLDQSKAARQRIADLLTQTANEASDP